MNSKTGIISFKVSSWDTQSVKENPTTTSSISVVDSSESLAVTVASTLATEYLVYDISLAEYPQITAQYTISVNIKECQVSDSDVSVPDYTEAKVIDLD